MKFYSPLRYPGGKNKLSKFISQVCTENDIDGHYIEPYAGGASVALYLLIEGYVSKITINDIDRSIYAFWYTVLNRNDDLCKRIKSVRVSVPTWKIQKNIQKNKENENLFDLGFSTLFLNRTNISGIINGGVIGGLEQKGNYKIDCRFNKRDIISRIQLIKKYKKSIQLFNIDAVDLIDKIESEPSLGNTIYYFDPPYYLKGKSLYVNFYKHEDHELVAEKIKKIKNAKWIVSYDDTKEIRKMYKSENKREYSIFHTAGPVKEGKEIIFHDGKLVMPRMSNF